MSSGPQFDDVLAIGYSYYLESNSAMLVVHAQRTGQDEDGPYWSLRWDLPEEAVEPEPLGVANALGISGLGGYHPNSTSPLNVAEHVWSARIRDIDELFERVLADLLSYVLLNEAKGAQHIVIQGPAFPKMVGRLAYRRVLERQTSQTITFLTFRRRFLSPSPVPEDPNEKNTNRQMFVQLRGPFPDPHDEALVRRFYLSWPHRDEFETHPLLVEAFAQGKDANWARARIDNLLQFWGVSMERDQNDVPPSNYWTLHPEMSQATPRRVWVPTLMYNASRKSMQRLDTLLGGQSADSGQKGILIPFPRLEGMKSFNSLVEVYRGENLSEAARHPKPEKVITWYAGLSNKEWERLFAK